MTVSFADVWADWESVWVPSIPFTKTISFSYIPRFIWAIPWLPASHSGMSIFWFLIVAWSIRLGPWSCFKRFLHYHFMSYVAKKMLGVALMIETVDMLGFLPHWLGLYRMFVCKNCQSFRLCIDLNNLNYALEIIASWEIVFVWFLHRSRTSHCFTSFSCLSMVYSRWVSCSLRNYSVNSLDRWQVGYYPFLDYNVRQVKKLDHLVLMGTAMICEHSFVSKISSQYEIVNYKRHKPLLVIY